MTRERAEELKQLVKEGLHLNRCQPYEEDYYPRIEEEDEIALLALIDEKLAKPVSNLCDHCFYAPSCEGADGTPAVSCNRFKEIELAKPVSEEVQKAMAIFQEHIDEAEAVVGHKPDCKYCKASRLAITALRAYQPKEPCDRKVTI